MTEAAEYTIGAQVDRSDGACGELERAVVDPVKRAITHLVVKRRHGRHRRLVPIKLVEGATQQELRLRCAGSSSRGAITPKGPSLSQHRTAGSSIRRTKGC